MTLYVAFCQDRHIDPVIEVFSTAEKACAFAREFMQENMSNPDGIEEEVVEGYILFLRYIEEDHAFVQEVTLDEPEGT